MLSEFITQWLTSPARWRDVPNVILTPHVADVPQNSIKRPRAAADRNSLTVLDGGPVVKIADV